MEKQARLQSLKLVDGKHRGVNFIKKSHQIMYSQVMNSHSFRYYNQDEKTNIPSYDTINYIREEHEEGNSAAQYHSAHNSLSKFRLSGAMYNQISQIYSIPSGQSPKKDKSKLYADTIKSNDELASVILSSKTNNKKHEAAKQFLLNMHKIKLPDGSSKSRRNSSLDNYDASPEYSFKFPIIDKRTISFSVSDQPEPTFTQLFNERVRDYEKNQPKTLVPKTDSIGMELSKKGKERASVPTRFLIKQQAYGLLPVFKTKVFNVEERRQRYMLSGKSGVVKIVKNENSGHPPMKQMLSDYLEQDIVGRTIEIPQSRKLSEPIANREVINAAVLDKRDQSELADQPEGNTKQIQSQLLDVQPAGTETQKESQAKNKPKKQVAAEAKYDGDLTIYDLKMRSYREFLFMINFAHRIFDPLILKDSGTFKPEQRYKYYLGKGNNYLLVKSLLKRRFWWTAEEDPKKANFVWTQLKINSFYQYERKAYVEKKNHKLDQDFVLPQEPKKKKNKVQNQVKNQQSKAGIFRAPLPPNQKKIFTNCDKKYYDQLFQKGVNSEKLLKFSNRLKYLDQNFLRSRNEETASEHVHNHLEYNYFIGNKKALFYNLKHYYDLQNKNVFQIIPLTYHIKNGTSDPQYQIFSKEFKRLAKEKVQKKDLKNIWIVKPGELSNRGQGITVIDEIYELNTIIKKKQKHFNGTQKTYIVQKYIEKPLLYKGRKFDIRHYMMISRLHGVMRAYWFGEGYIRTSSSEFNINEIGDESIHLTNDAIQKYCDSYGKYEEGNKVSYNEFQRYMDSTYGENKFNFSEMIYPRMREIALEAVKATFLQLDPNNTEHNFQVFGLDFMIDANFKVWLIEVNTNPCLELSSKLLSRIIPMMVEHSFRLTLDVIFPPPTHYPNSQKYLAPDNPLERLQFELIFDEDRDGKEIEQLFVNCKGVDMGRVDEEDETYENDGKQIELQNQIE